MLWCGFKASTAADGMFRFAASDVSPCTVRSVEYNSIRQVSGDSFCSQSLQRVVKCIQASEFDGGMTVSGPSKSRMMRRRGPGVFSWYW